MTTFTKTSNETSTQFIQTSAVISKLATAFDFYEALNVLADEYLMATIIGDTKRQEMLSKLIDFADKCAADKGFSEQEIARQSQFV